MCLIVRFVVIVVLDEISVAGVALLSVAGADWSAGAVVTGWVCWAASWAMAWVEESANAAAIAGKAWVRACG